MINLASKKYSLCITRFVPAGARLITCVFGEQQAGKNVEKGTMCKMARGEMVRYMAENQIENPAELRQFDRLNYRYSAECSDEKHLFFSGSVPAISKCCCISNEKAPLLTCCSKGAFLQMKREQRA